MIDLLIIQHEKDTPPGTVLEWAKNKNLSVRICNIFENAEFLPLDEFKALIICGGSMDTFEEEKFPWLKNEKEFLKKCVNANKAIFGLCLGSQLLAEVLGAKVYPFKKWEIGFVPVQILAQKLNENCIEVQSLNVFHWHQCTFELPEKAQLLATNSFCPNQAFTYGKNIVATQFHPEATIEWIQECSDSVMQGQYQGLVQNKKEMLDSISLQVELKNWFFKTLDIWFCTT